MRKVSISGVCAVLVLSTGGCNGDIHVSAPPPPDPALVVAYMSGNNQTGAAGRQLPAVLFFEVTTPDGKLLGNEKVVWSTTTGGSLSPASGYTNHAGSSFAYWTLGPGTGAQRAKATLPRFGHEVLFSATATTPPPSN